MIRGNLNLDWMTLEIPSISNVNSHRAGIESREKSILEVVELGRMLFWFRKWSRIKGKGKHGLEVYEAGILKGKSHGDFNTLGNEKSKEEVTEG